MVPEEACKTCGGSGSSSAGLTCMFCDGTGVEVPNFVQDSFEQHGNPEKPGKDVLDKIIKLGEVKLGINGEEEQTVFDVTINLKGDADFKSKGIFGDFMDGVKAAETGRTPIRFLMIQEVDELLDLYNDYKQLYDMFQDKEHLEYMNGIKKVLKAKTKK